MSGTHPSSTTPFNHVTATPTLYTAHGPEYRVCRCARCRTCQSARLDGAAAAGPAEVAGKFAGASKPGSGCQRVAYLDLVNDPENSELGNYYPGIQYGDNRLNRDCTERLPVTRRRLPVQGMNSE
eukprot:111875-Hanusia_phi.AAC.1